MKFSQRFAYYLLGLMIGIFGVFMFIDAKETESFCYLPNCRVLKNIRSKPFHVADEAEKDFSLLTKEEVQTFLTYGDVDFEKSNTNKNGGKLYIIEGKDKNMNEMTFEIINYEDRVVLQSITK